MKVELSKEELSRLYISLYVYMERRKNAIAHYKANNNDGAIKILNDSLPKLEALKQKLETAAQEAT